MRIQKRFFKRPSRTENDWVDSGFVVSCSMNPANLMSPHPVRMLFYDQSIVSGKSAWLKSELSISEAKVLAEQLNRYISVAEERKAKLTDYNKPAITMR